MIMAREFLVNFFYKDEPKEVKVILQTFDEELKIQIDAENQLLPHLSKREKVGVALDRKTGNLKDPQQFKGSLDIIERIVEAVKEHEQNKHPVGLWG